MTMEEENPAQAILDDMKKTGIIGAIIRKDGIAAASTLALQNPEVIISLANATDMLLKREQDKQEEIDISFSNMKMVIIPVKNYYFCAVIREKAEKKTVREYVGKAAGVL